MVSFYKTVSKTINATIESCVKIVLYRDGNLANIKATMFIEIYLRTWFDVTVPRTLRQDKNAYISVRHE